MPQAVAASGACTAQRVQRQQTQCVAATAPCRLKPWQQPFLGDPCLAQRRQQSSNGRRLHVAVSNVAAPEQKVKPQSYGNGKVVKVRRRSTAPPPLPAAASRC